MMSWFLGREEILIAEEGCGLVFGGRADETRSFSATCYAQVLTNTHTTCGHWFTIVSEEAGSKPYVS